MKEEAAKEAADPATCVVINMFHVPLSMIMYVVVLYFFIGGGESW